MRFLSQLLMLRHMPNQLCLLWYSPKHAFWCNFVCIYSSMQKKRKRAQFSIRTVSLSVCMRFRCVCAENFSHSTWLFRKQSRASFMLALCLRQVLILSPDKWVWTRMHVLAVMHRWTICENVDSAKIKVPIYTIDRYWYFTRSIDASHCQTSYRSISINRYTPTGNIVLFLPSTIK